MNKITVPEFSELESDLISEFLDCFNENIEEIQIAIQHLETDVSPERINELFRSVHSLKGNCRMVFLEPLVAGIHELEEIIHTFRDGSRQFRSEYCEFIGNAVNCFETLMGQLVKAGEADGDLFDKLRKLITEVAKNNNPDNSLLQTDPTVCTKELSESSKAGLSGPFELGQDNDLQVFRHLADQLDNTNVFRKGRTSKELELCHAINDQLTNPLDKEQLSAGVMLHDLGMAFVPATILSKVDTLKDEEVNLIRAHVSTGAKIAMQMGWKDAAYMVMHHHEKYDGTGYPHGLSGEDIPLGSRIIAVSDTFFAVTNERADRSYKKTLFSAVRLINNESEIQFDQDCVEAFNTAVRALYISR